MIFVVNFLLVLSGYRHLVMSFSCVPYFVRFCSVASSVNQTNMDCEAYRLRVFCIPLLEPSDDPYADNYRHFIVNYLKVLKTGKLDIDDVIFSICYIADKYYPEEQRQYMAINTLVLRELFEDFNLF